MKQILILGAGESGVGTAILAQKKGYTVLVSDQSKIQESYKKLLIKYAISFEEEGHQKAWEFPATVVVKSPGIPDKAPIVQHFLNKGIAIDSEIEFAAQYTTAYCIGITGTNGKTTTTLLTYHILKSAGLNVGLAGNIGKSFAWQIAECDYDHYVLELSSFQIDGMKRKCIDTAVITNITPDHLDRYNYDYKLYINSKKHLLDCLKSNGLFIYSADNSETNAIGTAYTYFKRGYSILSDVREGCLKNNHSITYFKTPNYTIDTKYSKIHGKHNQSNTLAALLVADQLNLPQNKVEEALKSFENAPHRLEYVGTINTIDFINDSKATNVDAAWYALDAMKAPVVWIVGGVDKGNDYNILLPLVQEKVKAIIALGTDTTKIIDFFSANTQRSIENCNTLEQAIEASLKHAKANDVVLLAPACASFDLFKNYEDRGTQFRTQVQERMKNL